MRVSGNFETVIFSSANDRCQLIVEKLRVLTTSRLTQDTTCCGNLDQIPQILPDSA